MIPAEKRLELCWESIRERLPFTPEAAVVLGSGLGDYVREIERVSSIAYGEIPSFPVSTVPGHEGRFVFGYAGQVPVVLMQGRVHYYEGYSMEDVVLPIRLMRKMGAEILLLTNAAGGIREDLAPGDLMLIRDQISCFVPSPLLGANPDSLGPRFADMSEIYRRDLREALQAAAREEGIPLREGVYLQLTGPAYETPAEIRMCRILGADAVGMSTACEAMAANHCGFRVCGISCITNMASGITDQSLSHEEVQAAADAAAPRIRRLLTAGIQKMCGKTE